MKTKWMFGLLMGLSVVVCGTISGTWMVWGQAKAEMPAPMLKRIKNDNAAVNLDDYVVLHETRDMGVATLAAAVGKACS